MQQLRGTARATHRASARGRIRALPDPAVAALIGAASALMAAAGSWVPSLWGDEVATIMSARRSGPSLAALLGEVDAVHGLHYAFMHAWIELVGASPFAVRLPSGIAVGAGAAGVYLLVRRRAESWVGLVAASVFALMPRVTHLATEARSMAIATALAVWLTLLLVMLIDGSARRAAWAAYAAGLALGAYLFLYAVLLIPVHAVVVLNRVARDRPPDASATARLRPFLIAWAAAAVLAAPIALLAVTQREQIAFRERQDVVSASSVLVAPWFMSPALAAASSVFIVMALIAVAVHRGDPVWSGRRELVVLAGAWALVPIAVALAVTALSTPVFTPRYLVVSAPGVAILLAVGVAALHPPSLRTAAVVTVVALSLPAYVDQRTPYAKNAGTDWQTVAAVVDEVAQPGDGIVFDESVRPSRRPRLALHGYPEQFRGLVDLTLVRPFHLTDGLWDVTAPLSSVADRLDGVDRVLVVSRSAHGVDADVEVLRRHGFESVERRALVSDVVAVFERRPDE